MRLICEGCRKTYEVAEGDAPRFCAQCGKALRAESAGAEDVIPLVDEEPLGGAILRHRAAQAPAAPSVPPVVVPPSVVAPVAPPVIAAPAAVAPGVVGAGAADEFELRPLQAPGAGTSGSASEPANALSDLGGGAKEGAAGREAALQLEFPAIRCPNCGEAITAGAEICTHCGYSRRLGRTLTTRVGKPEIPKHKQETRAGEEAHEPQIEAEKEYQRAKARKAGRAGDGFRVFVSVVALLLLGAAITLAPMGLLKGFPIVLPPPLDGAGFDQMNASLALALFVLLVVPITALGMRIGAAITNIELTGYLVWLRTAGTLAAVLLTAEIIYSVDQIALHLEPKYAALAIAGEAAVALLIFTWYLQNVRLGAAIVLWFVMLVAAAVGIFAAGAAFHPLGNLLGIGPVVPGVGEWVKRLQEWKLPG